jgi:hypothetical protein
VRRKRAVNLGMVKIDEDDEMATCRQAVCV